MRLLKGVGGADGNRLQSLNLRANYIGDEGALKLAEAVNALPVEKATLRELDLQANDFGVVGQHALVQALQAKKVAAASTPSANSNILMETVCVCQ